MSRFGGGQKSHGGGTLLECSVGHPGGDIRLTAGPQEYTHIQGHREGWSVPGGGCRERHTAAQRGSETVLSFACQARASRLLLDPIKSIGTNSGFGSAPGDTKQCPLTLTPPAASAGGLSLISKGARPESAPPGPEPV